ncbi:hypothetical protein AUEXF2481DRAFT_8433 [Aureobasidium subglaciale EXF-2481]|uniref:Uncharacterized protein n=1 Tax=Aureobasidium subglaciale (strain EXF-2481) TaxID=1043005 RepID=A0A074Y6I4_AURSE|nr:uncharacterized protein AUEXF2481DRAFT_8433 [Aureobasidium subglaciale EXF-2481]KEQ91564.1 hypothetical protein AUEXF2481DRAFT_8433 [Aureobasidium subglaciale EXF-2481]
MAEPAPSLGYGNKTGKELTLDQYLNFLSTPADFGDVIPTILVVHARGTKGDDEERLKDLGVDIDATFMHVVDTQTFASARLRRPGGGELATKPNSRPLHHCGVDDAFVTGTRHANMVLDRATELGLDLNNGPRVQILNLDFEGGNGPTTEIGTASMMSTVLHGLLEHATVTRNRIVAKSLVTSHIIIAEVRDRHPSRDTQARMYINSNEAGYYPRFNARTGPSGIKKVLQHYEGSEYLMSPDSRILPSKQAMEEFYKLFPPPPTKAQLTTTNYTLPIG